MRSVAIIDAGLGINIWRLSKAFKECPRKNEKDAAGLSLLCVVSVSKAVP